MPIDVIDRYNNVGKKKRWKAYSRGDKGSRNRAKCMKFDFTPRFIICWIEILIYYGIICTKTSPLNFWVSIPYGIYAPWI